MNGRPAAAAPHLRSALAYTSALALAVAGVAVAPTAASPAAAAPAPLDPVIVSMNLHTLRTGMTLKTTRPQTRTALLEYPPTLTSGIRLQWGDGDYSLTIGATQEQPLHRGTFTALNTGTKGSEFHDVGMSMQSYAFDGLGGRIEVLDLASDHTGRLTRFDILYELYDATSSDNAIGELRMNEPDAVPALSPTAQQFHWPRLTVRGAAYLVTDTFRNTTTRAVTVGRATVSGGAVKDFAIRADSCSDRILAAGADCDVTIAYRPTTPGPRVSTLVVPASGHVQRVDLTGGTKLGTSTMTTYGSDSMDLGQKHTFSPVLGFGFGKINDTDPEQRFYWTGDPESTEQNLRNFNFAISSTSGPIRTGTHPVDPARHTNYDLWVQFLDSHCSETHGSVSIKAIKVSPDGQPTYVDLTFNQYCRTPSSSEPSGTVHGHLRYQARADTVTPSAPTHLSLTGRRVHWTKSTSRDLSTTIVRIETGGRSTATTGIPLSVGSSTSATLPALRRGQSYRLAAFSVDRAGNVSKAASKTFVY